MPQKPAAKRRIKTDIATKVKPRIAVVGSGVVGEATGTVLQSQGFNVTFVDNNSIVLKKLKQRGYQTSSPEKLDPRGIDIYFVSVPTYTTTDGGGTLNLRSAAVSLGKLIKKAPHYSLVVIRSTVLPGTVAKTVIPTIEKYSGKKEGKGFGVCVNPEYLREKCALADFEAPWLVVIGESRKKDGDMLQRVYHWVDCPVYRVSIAEAEMQKFVHNIFNANKIAFFNEMRSACGKLGLECDLIYYLVTESAEGMWNPKYGIKDYGPFSGSCLPKDTSAFLRYASQELKLDMKILNAVVTSNERLKKRRKQG